ncbi:MAG: Hsp20 family protein [Coriobacteriales bacterium]|nr:Hsp20 family protein [Coriobacteriales bacterium]
MAGMVPYSDYEKALRRAWPFNAFDDFFAPLATIGSEDAFKMDVEDAGDKYVVSAELPGVKKDQIDVELNEGNLTVTVDKKESDEQKNKNYLQKETSEWHATRGVYLKDAAKEGLSAKFDNGVLTVNIPKLDDKKSSATKVTIE